MVLQPLDSEQGTFTLTTGITIMDKGWFKDWHQPIIEKMVNNPITKGGGKNLTKNWVSDNKTHTTTDTVATRYDIFI